jgi:glutathione-regulated potassium-efflux system ancillary protein KefG
MSTPNKRVLVLLAHPHLEASRINAALARAARDVEGVTLHHLYHAYPDGFINVAAEQALLLAHDVVVLQFPLYWYSVPPLLKTWLDEVLQNGWAFGQDGNALSGKALRLCVSSGGDPADYGRHEQQFTLAELLRPLEASARYCGMRYLGHVAYGASENVNAHLSDWAEHYAKQLTALVAGDVPADFDSR